MIRVLRMAVFLEIQKIRNLYNFLIYNSTIDPVRMQDCDGKMENLRPLININQMEEMCRL